MKLSSEEETPDKNLSNRNDSKEKEYIWYYREIITRDFFFFFELRITRKF